MACETLSTFHDQKLNRTLFHAKQADPYFSMGRKLTGMSGFSDKLQLGPFFVRSSAYIQLRL
jgi:hypothetical protein